MIPFFAFEAAISTDIWVEQAFIVWFCHIVVKIV
jgi:hypothetical protein